MRVSRDGQGKTYAQKNHILKLARKVPRYKLLLGLQLERDWHVSSIVGCHNTMTYWRKRRAGKMVCIVDLPGIRKEDVGPETIMVHFKGGKNGARLSREEMA